MRGQFKGEFLDYIAHRYPHLVPLYNEIDNKKNNDYWQQLAAEIAEYAHAKNFPYRINDLPYGRSEQGKPVIINFFYHEKIRKQ